MSDNLVLESGYTLSVILSAGVLNHLLNSKAAIPRRAATLGVKPLAARHQKKLIF
jgi:hypothetical protein